MKTIDFTGTPFTGVILRYSEGSHLERAGLTDLG
jgi:hypothetical protein